MTRGILIIVFMVVAIVAVAVVLVPDKIVVPFTDHAVRLVRDDFELSVFFQRGSWLPQGITPYHQSIFQEYPQFGLGYISLPYLVADSYVGYRTVLIVLNALAYGLLVVLTWKLLRHLRRSSWYLLLLLLPSMLYFGLNRFDVLVALTVQASLLLLLTKRYRWAFVLLAAAFLIKWYALLFLPLYWLYLRRSQEALPIRQQYGLVGLFVGIIGVAMLGSLIIDGAYSLRPYLFHSSRPGGVGSLYYLLFHATGLASFLPLASQLVLPIFFLFQFSAPVYVLLRQRWVTPRLTDERLIQWIVVSVIVFVTFSRFYSPQWILWWLPLVLLVIPKRWIWLLIVFDVANYLSFPVVWQAWGAFSPAYTGLSVVIVTALITVVVLLYRHGRTERNVLSAPPASPSPGK